MILLQNVLKMSPRCICETSWRRFEAVLKTSWQDVLKMSWRRVENVLKTFWQDVLKTSWRRLENILKTSWRRMDKTNILVLTKTSWRCLEDVFWRRMISKDIFVFIKSWRCLLKTKTKDVFKTCSRCLHQDECLLGCVNYMLSRGKLVPQTIYVKLCKDQPIDVFMTYIFQSFKGIRENFAVKIWWNFTCFFKNSIFPYRFMARVAKTIWLTYLVMSYLLLSGVNKGNIAAHIYELALYFLCFII